MASLKIGKLWELNPWPLAFRKPKARIIPLDQASLLRKQRYIIIKMYKAILKYLKLLDLGFRQGYINILINHSELMDIATYSYELIRYVSIQFCT